MKTKNDDFVKIKNFISENDAVDYTVFTSHGVTAIVCHKPKTPYADNNRNILTINRWCRAGRSLHDVYCLVPGKYVAFMFSIYSKSRREVFVYTRNYVADNRFMQAVYANARNSMQTPEARCNSAQNPEDVHYITNENLHSFNLDNLPL